MIATLFNAYTDHDPTAKPKTQPFKLFSFAEAQSQPDEAVVSEWAIPKMICIDVNGRIVHPIQT